MVGSGFTSTDGSHRLTWQFGFAAVVLVISVCLFVSILTAPSRSSTAQAANLLRPRVETRGSVSAASYRVASEACRALRVGPGAQLFGAYPTSTRLSRLWRSRDHYSQARFSGLASAPAVLCLYSGNFHRGYSGPWVLGGPESQPDRKVYPYVTALIIAARGNGGWAVEAGPESSIPSVPLFVRNVPSPFGGDLHHLLAGFVP
jgi:hypothetical protein